MNFHSSTVSSNLLLIISESGANISANVVGGSSLDEYKFMIIYWLGLHACSILFYFDVLDFFGIAYPYY